MSIFRTLALATGLSTTLLFSHLVSAAEMEKVSVTVPADNSAFTPVFIAKDKGYFSKEGLDVEIIKAGGGTATPALISGSINFSSSQGSALSAILRGAPLKILLVNGRVQYEIWSTSPDIKTVADLKGQILAIVTRGDTMEIATRMFLAQRHLGHDYLSFSPLGRGAGRLAAIASGNQPVAVLMEVDRAQLNKMHALDKGHMIVDLTKEVSLATGGLAINARELAEHRDRTKRFLVALRKGARYMTTFPNAAIDVLHKRLPKAPQDALQTDMDEYLKVFIPKGTISLEAAQHELDTRGEIMKVPPGKVPTADKVYDFSLVREIDHDLDASGWKPTL